ncbi:MAG: serine/threonine protein kinase [Lachnospiraceae bacterium]|nr:serine/threonine protein kinase [Lachnospiraceae bacterium]
MDICKGSIGQVERIFDMDNMESLQKDFLESYKNIPLPAAIASEFENVSCLAANEKKCVYLVKSLTDGQKMVLKTSVKKDSRVLYQEYRNIVDTDPDEAGKIRYGAEDETEWLLRPWYEGKTLEEYISERGSLSIEEATDIMQSVCAQVSHLHKHNPPIIHRDLKPENILLTEEGTCRIIDFDSAREYKPGEAHDTFYMGTEKTAAPEQFGFMQTDERTDIYGLGMLFMFLLTGSYERRPVSGADVTARVGKCLGKCLAFDPDDRYKNVDILINDLKAIEKAENRKKIKAGWAIGALAVIAAVVAICIICFRGKDTGSVNNVSGSDRKTAEFVNPLIEQAARLSLGKLADDELYEAELDTVETLILCGDRAFRDEQEHQDFHNDDYKMENVGEAAAPADINDIRKFKNLKTLSLCNQGLTDIGELAGLKLESLDISKNPLKSLAGLENMTSLKYLKAANSGLEDISAIKGLKLNKINLFDVKVGDLAPLEGMESLIDLNVFGASTEDIRVINSLTSLEELGLMNSKLKSFEEISGLKDLTILNLSGSFELETLEGIEQLPSLFYLDLRMADKITDLTPLTKLKDLHYLTIFQCENIADLSPIKNIESLSELYIGASQVDRVNELGLEGVNVTVW